MHIALDDDTDPWLAVVVVQLLDPLATAYPEASCQAASLALRPVLGLVLLFFLAYIIAAGLDFLSLRLVLAILKNGMCFFLKFNYI